MALLVGAMPFEIREVVLRSKPSELLAASTKATVPVLVRNDQEPLDQSLDIMRWVLGQNDPEHWLAGDDVPLIELFDDRFKFHLDHYKYADRLGVDPIDHRQEALDVLHLLEERLAIHANLCRTTRSFADVAIMPFVRQFAGVERGWFDAQPIPRVQAWLARHTASRLFEQAMTRLTPWSPGNAAIMWPKHLPHVEGVAAH